MDVFSTPAPSAERATDDRSRPAKAFYSKLFGWSTKDMQMSSVPTRPARWRGVRRGSCDFPELPVCRDGGVYVTVADVDRNDREAEKLGGAVLVPRWMSKVSDGWPTAGPAGRPAFPSSSTRRPRSRFSGEQLQWRKGAEPVAGGPLQMARPSTCRGRRAAANVRFHPRRRDRKRRGRARRLQCCLTKPRRSSISLSSSLRGRVKRVPGATKASSSAWRVIAYSFALEGADRAAPVFTRLRAVARLGGHRPHAIE